MGWQKRNMIRALFLVANQMGPSMSFMDELDSILSAQDGGNKSGWQLKTKYNWSFNETEDLLLAIFVQLTQSKILPKWYVITPNTYVSRTSILLWKYRIQSIAKVDFGNNVDES